MKVINNADIKAKYQIASTGLEIAEKTLRTSQLSVGGLVNFEGIEVPQYLVDGNPTFYD